MSNFTNVLHLYEIILRIFMAIIIGGMIGYERGHQNRPAGFRTHILVCLGAAIVSLIQEQLRINLHNYAILFPESQQLFRTDLGRIGAQVVSGIGFLGAGTIMRDKGIIGGLTTAASIWATGCLGLAIGWGFYHLAIPAGVAIIIVLVTLKKFELSWIENKHISRIEVQFYENIDFTKALLMNYNLIKGRYSKIKNIEKIVDENKAIYTLILGKQVDIMDILSELSTSEYVANVELKQ